MRDFGYIFHRHIRSFLQIIQQTSVKSITTQHQGL